MTTYWQLPDGTRGQSEVEVPSEPRTVHERVERTLAFHADRIAQEHEDAVRERGGERNLVCIVNTRLRGFRASVFPHCAAFVETFVTAKHPMIRRLATRTERGFDPVYVRVDHGGGLRWVARRRGEDLQVPRPVDERDEGEGE